MKKIIGLLLSLLIVLNLAPLALAQDVTYDIYGTNVYAPTKEQIASFANTYDPGVDSPFSFNAEPNVQNPYYPGELSDTTLAHAINSTNLVRYVAGLEFAVAGDEQNNLAQYAALVNHANGNISHYPSRPSDMDQSTYDLGYQGSGESSLHYGMGSYAQNSMFDVIVHSFMADKDNSNIAMLGHRRWIIYPELYEAGFGGTVTGSGNSAHMTSAMHVIGGQQQQSDIYGVAWPSYNTPTNMFKDDYPWSYSYGEAIYGDLSVTLTRLNDNEQWIFSYNGSDGYFNVDNQNYGAPGCVIFRPDNISYSAGDVFHVQISGGAEASYIVDFFDIDSYSSNESNLDRAEIPSTYTFDGSAVPPTPVTPEPPVTPEIPDTDTTPETDTTPDIGDYDSYTDGASEWAKPEIKNAVEAGLLADIESILNNYTTSITRVQFAELALNMYIVLGGEYTDEMYAKSEQGYLNFTDTDSDAVFIAYGIGIVNGVSDTEFAPDKNITRQEMAVMLNRVYAMFKTSNPTSNLAKYTDRGSIASWAFDSVAFMNELGIMQGVSDSEISPLTNVSREQAIALAYRTLQSLSQ